jgi:N-acetylmuramoyl-L-alanine amidase
MSAAALMLTVPAAAPAAVLHVVAPGESLSSVAASDGLSVEQLAAANGLSAEAGLSAGSSLVIPPRAAAAEGSQAPVGAVEEGAAEVGTASAQAAPPSADNGSYVVQPGDTLSQIAARAGTSVEGLAALNGIDPDAPLLSGVVLRLPEGSSEQPAVTEQGQSPTVGAAGEEAPYPTQETVSPSAVGQVASEHGVPPSLAEAIAEQESGFNNGLTSSANARGVMQILPETWTWINQDLASPPPLAPASAASNVRGGVLFLQWLLNESEGDPARAAAGYYQGLESVRREGEAPETEQYVNSVLALQERFAGE